MMKKIYAAAITGLMIFGVMAPNLLSAQESAQEEEIDILELLLNPPEKEKKEEPFSDIFAGSAHYLAAKNLYDNRIIQGFSDGTFRPNEPVNRVEALSMILNSAKKLPSESLEETREVGLPEDTVIDLTFPFETDIRLKTPSMETPIVLEQTGILQLILPKGGTLKSGRIVPEREANFIDINKEEWYYPVLRRAVSLEIVKGYDDLTFRPSNPVKLTEALAMLLKAHRVPVSDLADHHETPADVLREEWYAKYFAYGLEKTLLTPSAENYVFPGAALTRGELATLIYRFTRNQTSGMKFGKASWYADGASVIHIPSRQEYHDIAHTAAHKEYAFGTILRVTNVKNGKFVDVAINDRGPFVPGRIVDLSRSAFAALAAPETGIASVQVEILQAGP